ncbi:MAG TPA: hypothetical protein GX004_05765, partial [Firmicutes bacterium]|nr:hypothetical protein [Bacillota bacterium]
MAFDSVKKIAAEYALDRAINYITKDPDKNLFVLLDFVEKVARAPGHKEAVKKIKAHFKDNPQIMEQTRRVASNTKMLYNLINSWVINGVFLGRTKRESIGRELGVSVPQLLLIDPTS